jgi:phage terminase large subunit-like protein
LPPFVVFPPGSNSIDNSTESQYDYLARNKLLFPHEKDGGVSPMMIEETFSPVPEDWTQSDWKAVEEGCYFDRKKAYEVWRFLTRHIKLSHGQWSGKPFIPQVWQWKKIIAPLFGWMRDDGTRRFRRAFIFIPKKNGKSTLCSALILYLLTEHEPTAEVYSVATATDQANIVYGETKRMVYKSREISSAVKILNSRKIIEFETSTYKALSGDAASSEGLNIHGLVIDELHAWKTRTLIELYRSLRYGGAARTQPLSIVITTAGEIEGDALWEEEYEAAKGVAESRLIDTNILPFLAEAGPNDDWTNPETWRKANPSYGEIIREEEMAEKCADAQTSERKKRDFLRYRLNCPVSSVSTWIDMDEWNKNDSTPEHLDGMEYFAGLDISSTSDLTAFVVVGREDRTEDGEPVFPVFPYFFIPEKTLVKHIAEGRMLYEQWDKSGLMTITPGNVTDNRTVIDAILKFHREHPIKEFLFDPWNASGIIQRLQEQNIECIEFRQGMKSFAEPTKMLETLIKKRRLRHGGHAVLSWNVANTEVKTDDNANIRPVKSKDRSKKIDGVVALIMALSRAMMTTEKSVYEERGVLFL